MCVELFQRGEHGDAIFDRSSQRIGAGFKEGPEHCLLRNAEGVDCVMWGENSTWAHTRRHTCIWIYIWHIASAGIRNHATLPVLSCSCMELIKLRLNHQLEPLAWQTWWSKFGLGTSSLPCGWFWLPWSIHEANAQTRWLGLSLGHAAFAPNHDAMDYCPTGSNLRPGRWWATLSMFFFVFSEPVLDDIWKDRCWFDVIQPAAMVISGDLTKNNEDDVYYVQDFNAFHQIVKTGMCPMLLDEFSPK